MIIFVGSNPSHSAKTLEPMCKSTPSGKKFDQWIDILGLPKYAYNVINVIDRVIPDNKQLKTSDITHQDIVLLHIKLQSATKIVALGVVPAAILEAQNIEYFAMPHPSPVSRKHNDPDFIKQKLKECRNYVLDIS